MGYYMNFGFVFVELSNVLYGYLMDLLNIGEFVEDVDLKVVLIDELDYVFDFIVLVFFD